MPVLTQRLKRPAQLIKRLLFPRGGPWARHRHGHHAWSIGLYEGSSPFRLRASRRVRNPILTPLDITDVRATTVADPFVIRIDQTWNLFFEVLNQQTDRGEIGLAVSEDGVSWKYRQIVLAEPFHLSYPYVFQHEHAIYMIPETHQARSVRLYRASRFPTDWSFVCPLLEGGYFADASPVRHEDMWWIFTETNPQHKFDTLRLFYAAELTGPWREHPSSPIVAGDPHIARPAGRILSWDGKLFRFAQDDSPTYGRQVRAFEITELTPLHYDERLASRRPILRPARRGWNRLGMHHADPYHVSNGRWLVYVDGLGVAPPPGRALG